MNGLIYWMSENILEWVFQVQFPKLRKTLTILLKFAISQFYQPSQVNFEIKLDEIPDILKYNSKIDVISKFAYCNANFCTIWASIPCKKSNLQFPIGSSRIMQECISSVGWDVGNLIIQPIKRMTKVQLTNQFLFLFFILDIGIISHICT